MRDKLKMIKEEMAMEGRFIVMEIITQVTGKTTKKTDGVKKFISKVVKLRKEIGTTVNLNNEKNEKLI